MDSAKKAVESVTEGVKKVAIGGPKKEKKPKGGAPVGDASQRALELSPPRGHLVGNHPADIAKGISNSLFKRTVVARLDGDPNKLWDLERPLEASCKLELLNFDDEQGQMVFWHSSAHILETGFYYEMALPDGGAIHEADWKPIETLVGSIVKEKQKFERLELSKDDLLEMFSYNKYKQHIIKDKIPDGTYTTVYRNGPLIDLCRGPHVPDTGRIEAFSILKNSASYFLGSQENDSLQRLYGISFPDKKRMAEHKKFLEEAAKRDHRRIGQEQELFFFHPLSPGSAFWLPHGSRIYNTLQAYIRNQYWKRGYEEVHTPNMYNADLWKQSGHWDYYQEDMFVIDVDKTKFALKPMNCPGHCLMFGHRERSHRELPIRYADFGVLHRNEASGALSGLTRVRRFQQDDAHIFCREDQIKAEMDDLFDFLKEMYGLLGFTFKLKLSTRPDKFLGEIETWDRAETMLKESLDEMSAKTGGVWELNEGDGAFYGPKIDVKVLDSLKREWQVATFQLDFMNPQSFNLEYVVGEAPVAKKEQEVKPEAAKPKPAEAAAPAAPAAEGDKAKGAYSREKNMRPLTAGCARPVMIHRAMAGSIERFTGILCEHFGGNNRMFVDVDTSGNTLQKKIRSAQLAQYNFIFVVGDEEMRGRQINVRFRDDTSTQDRGKPVALDEAIEKLVKLRDDNGMYNPFPPRRNPQPKATRRNRERA
ncbi:unnamed protein product [Parascedosporium putredinis]|uniref:threonine--tRNA ligase n=1 Tax=Parascedosporium putredinis TaxID=1442378 RepID=A0A9P1H3D8_9PEZI|nr:unnamed protein product [Parascedosporium putredinis]CAI7994640.1 unnamed protein product [Parascedosporium putredinis]